MGTRGAPALDTIATLEQLQSLLPALNSLVAHQNARHENDEPPGTTTPPPELRESQAPPEMERTPRTDVHLQLYTQEIDKMVDETQSHLANDTAKGMPCMFCVKTIKSALYDIHAN